MLMRQNVNNDVILKSAYTTPKMNALFSLDVYEQVWGSGVRKIL